MQYFYCNIFFGEFIFRNVHKIALGTLTTTAAARQVKSRELYDEINETKAQIEGLIQSSSEEYNDLEALRAKTVQLLDPIEDRMDAISKV